MHTSILQKKTLECCVNSRLWTSKYSSKPPLIEVLNTYFVDQWFSVIELFYHHLILKFFKSNIFSVCFFKFVCLIKRSSNKIQIFLFQILNIYYKQVFKDESFDSFWSYSINYNEMELNSNKNISGETSPYLRMRSYNFLHKSINNDSISVTGFRCH